MLANQALVGIDQGLPVCVKYILDSFLVNSLFSKWVSLQVPVYFEEDLFSLLTEERRPDFRWLIMVTFTPGGAWQSTGACPHMYECVVQMISQQGKAEKGLYTLG